MEYLVGYLGTPFAWSIFVVLATAVAAAMIVYGIHALRRTDEPDPLFGGVSGMLKQDWARTKQIDFHLPEPDSTSPQQLILRVEERKIVENSMGQEVAQLRWRLATVEEAKEVVACWNAHAHAAKAM
jgi:hypothetical protein